MDPSNIIPIIPNTNTEHDLLTCVGVAPPPGSGVGPDIDPLHVVTGQVQRGSEGPGLQTCVLEVLRVVDLLLSHLLHFPDLHGLLLLELLLLHEGLLGLLLLLELLGLPDCGLLLEYLLLLLLLDQPLLLEGGLLLGLLLDEVISEGAGLTSADRIVINDPTLGLLLPLGEEFSACNKQILCRSQSTLNILLSLCCVRCQCDVSCGVCVCCLVLRRPLSALI